MSAKLGNVLTMLHQEQPNISFTSAMFLAQRIVDMMEDSERSAEKGAYQRGYEQGRSEVEGGFEAARNKRAYDKAVENARKGASLIVMQFGRDRKIRCIKQLREDYGIGLKDAKDIIDEQVRVLTDPPF